MAAGKRYSAGRIFLQVVPSFKNLQNDIQRAVAQQNAPLEKQHEKLGEQHEKARQRGAEKARKVGQQRELNDLEKFFGKQRAAHSRFHQGLITSRIKAGEAERSEMGRNMRYELDLARRTAAGHAKILDEAYKENDRRDKKAAKDKADRDARNAQRWLDREIEIGKNAAKAEKAAADARERAAEEQRRREQKLEQDHYNYQSQWRRKIEADEARAKDDAQREIDRKAARDEAARDRILRRRAGARLADMRRTERERQRLAGGGTGALLRQATKGAADSIGVTKIDADSSEAERKIAALREKLIRLHADVGVNINSGEAFAEIKLLQKELNHLARKSPDVHVSVNAKLALVMLKRVEEQIDQINRKKASSGFLSMFGGAAAGADQGANSFRIFNFRILGLLALLPTLYPLLASAAGAIGAIGTAAIGGAAGLGIMIVGFTGLGDAISALSDVQANKAKDDLANEKAVRTAAKGLRDAEQGVTRARDAAARSAEDSARRVADARRRVGDVEKQTARSIRDALRAQQDAEKGLADAQKDATKAQQELRDARKQAQQDQQDLADKIKAGQLDERQSLIDLFNAQVEYNAAMADGGSTNLEKEQVSINLERARMAIAGVRKENKALLDEQKSGNPKAAQAVADAQDRVVSANDRVKDAQQNVADAAERRKDAEVQGARDIADAQRGVTDALRDQAQSAADSQTSIRDAQERLGDAQAAMQEAMTKTGDIGSSSMQKLEQAMGKLGPAGQNFARFIFGLQDQWLGLRNLIQEGMLPPLQKEIGLLVDTYGPAFKDFAKVMAGAVGSFFTALGTALRGPEMKSFFDTMAKYAPTFFTQFGDLFINIMKIVAGLAKAFAPFAKDFMDGLVGMTGEWAKWADGLDKSDGFKKFIDYVKTEGPKVWKLIQDIGIVLLHIGQGLSSSGAFDMIVGFFDFLAGVDPNIIAGIAIAIGGFAVASQVAAGINALGISIGFLMRSAMGPWVLGLMAAAAAVIWLYNNVDWFHDALDAIGRFFRDVLIPQFLEGWQQLMDFFYDLGVQFMDGIHQIADGFKWLWGYLEGAWNTVGKPLFDIIGKIFTGDFVGAFDAATKMVSTIWDKLLQAFKTPINWIINSVLNEPLFSGINSILDFLGIDARIPTIMPITTPAPAGSGFAGSRRNGKNAALFDVGGWTGPGTKYQPAGIVHADEFVLKKESTNKLRAQIGLEGLNFMNQYGMLPTAGYAIGGMVKPVNVAPRFPWGHYPSGAVHRALDLAAPAGTPIASPFSGTIIRDGWDNTGFGNHVRLAADNGTFWILGHMLKELVSVGQRVLGGQLLGYVGSTGHSTGNHLHLEGRTSPYDPSSAFNFTGAFNGGVTRTAPVAANGQPAGASLPWWADKPIEGVRSLINSATEKIKLPGLLGTLLRGFPNKIFDGAKSFLAQLLGGGEADLDSAYGGKAFWAGREVPNNGTMMFDRGGLLQPGVTQVLNMTGKPEPVFTADQWASRGGSQGPAPLVGHLDVDINGSDLQAYEVADEIMRRVARVAHGGKYAGRAF